MQFLRHCHSIEYISMVNTIPFRYTAGNLNLMRTQPCLKTLRPIATNIPQTGYSSHARERSVFLHRIQLIQLFTFTSGDTISKLFFRTTETGIIWERLKYFPSRVSWIIIFPTRISPGTSHPWCLCTYQRLNGESSFRSGARRGLQTSSIIRTIRPEAHTSKSSWIKNTAT